MALGADPLIAIRAVHAVIPLTMEGRTDPGGLGAKGGSMGDSTPSGSLFPIPDMDHLMEQGRSDLLGIMLVVRHGKDDLPVAAPSTPELAGYDVHALAPPQSH